MNFSALSSLPAHWPIDWILIGALAAFLALDVIRAGAARVCTLALSLPAALLLLSLISHAAVVGSISAQFSTPTLQAVLFLILFVLMYFAVNRIGLSYGSESGAPIQALLAGIAGAAIMLVVWFQIPALDSVWHFGPQVQEVFGEAYRFWWLLASYIILAFVRG